MYARQYETVTLVDADSGDEGRDKVLARIKEALEKTGGREVRLEDWGRRKTAFRLRRSKATRALYLYNLYLGTNKTVAEVERLLKITEEALLWQTILVDDRVKIDDFDFDAGGDDTTIMAVKTAEAAERAEREAIEAAERAEREAVEAAERAERDAVDEARRATEAKARAKAAEAEAKAAEAEAKAAEPEVKAAEPEVKAAEPEVKAAEPEVKAAEPEAAPEPEAVEAAPEPEAVEAAPEPAPEPEAAEAPEAEESTDDKAKE